MPGRGIKGIYTTVTGTSAEDADCGQVGRGNRVNGIIPLTVLLAVKLPQVKSC